MLGPTSQESTPTSDVGTFGICRNKTTYLPPASSGHGTRPHGLDTPDSARRAGTYVVHCLRATEKTHDRWVSVWVNWCHLLHEAPGTGLPVLLRNFVFGFSLPQSTGENRRSLFSRRRPRPSFERLRIYGFRFVDPTKRQYREGGYRSKETTVLLRAVPSPQLSSTSGLTPRRDDIAAWVDDCTDEPRLSRACSLTPPLSTISPAALRAASGILRNHLDCSVMR